MTDIKNPAQFRRLNGVEQQSAEDRKLAINYTASGGVAKQLKQLSNNKWKPALTAAGVDPKHLDGNHHPCPACGGTDRFKYDKDKTGGLHYCNQCGAGDGFDLLKKMGIGSFPDRLEHAARHCFGKSIQEEKPTQSFTNFKSPAHFLEVMPTLRRADSSQPYCREKKNEPGHDWLVGKCQQICRITVV